MNTQQLVHAEITELFTPWIDAELAPAQEKALESHLAGCDACRASWDEFAGAVAAVRGVERYRLPAGFSRRVIARTRIERRKRLARVREMVLPLVPAEVALPLLLIAAVAAVVLLLLAS